MQPISQTTYNRNSILLVCYSSHDLNNEPFKEKTILDHSNTKLVHYSDPPLQFFIQPSVIQTSTPLKWSEQILTCVFENESCNFVQVTLRQFVFVDKLLGNLIRVLKREKHKLQKTKTASYKCYYCELNLTREVIKQCTPIWPTCFFVGAHLGGYPLLILGPTFTGNKN